jgi:hypothetical protein
VQLALVLFKILYCCNSIFMGNILFCHGYTTKYVIINGIKMLIYTNNCMGNCKIAKIGDIGIKSGFRLICGYFFVTGYQNKTENEILSFRTLNTIRTRQRSVDVLVSGIISINFRLNHVLLFVTFLPFIIQNSRTCSFKSTKLEWFSIFVGLRCTCKLKSSLYFIF